LIDTKLNNNFLFLVGHTFIQKPTTMTRLLSSIIVVAIGTTATAFILPFSSQDQQRLLATANDDTDFDAPVLKTPVMKGDAPTVLDHEIMIVDDECYLGKYGQYEHCVDFGELECVCLMAQLQS
jgi:hypothetical protein